VVVAECHQIRLPLLSCLHYTMALPHSQKHHEHDERNSCDEYSDVQIADPLKDVTKNAGERIVSWELVTPLRQLGDILVVAIVGVPVEEAKSQSRHASAEGPVHPVPGTQCRLTLSQPCGGSPRMEQR
jgi:hypothetical protein